uniref:Rieske domain-containing protein n=2 Tax=Physcomitrium patens TaxID=3218 RepID=A0A2K1IX80_PHYPA|nr:hypothetical protein PHYPA_023706 [Physcomitrium patens]
MATTTMAMTCSASSLNAHSSCSSSSQAGCSSTTQDLAWFPQRLGNGSQTSSKRTVLVRAGKGPPKQGRGYNSKKAAAEGIKKIMRERESDSSSDGWVQVLTEAELPDGKNKAIIYNNAGYVLVKRDNELYAIQANCTSCKFPVIEGTVSVAEAASDGPSQGETQIECPLCHTKFSLEDGRVVEYCPKDGPLAWAIGTLKQKEAPVPAKVYSARISKSGRVYVKFAAGSPAIP